MSLVTPYHRATRSWPWVVKKKKLVDQVCIYCALSPAVTWGHVSARSFFVDAQRGNLPQAPSCVACNNEKSKLELYLVTVLMFGGQHADAPAMLNIIGARRLAKNVRLHHQLAASAQHVTLRDATGQSAESLALDIDGASLERLFAFITRGLLWCQWDVLFDAGHDVKVMGLSAIGQEIFEPLLASNASQRVSVSLGDGTFAYEATQGTDDSQLSFWKFTIYGDVQLAGDLAEPNEQHIRLFAFTGANGLLDKLEEALTSSSAGHP